MGVTESSFMCAIRPFFWVLPANTSISSVRLHTFLFTALSLKNVVNVVILPHVDEHNSKVCAAFEPLKFHFTRPSENDSRPTYFGFLRLSICSIKMQREYNFLGFSSNVKTFMFVALHKKLTSDFGLLLIKSIQLSSTVF